MTVGRSPPSSPLAVAAALAALDGSPARLPGGLVADRGAAPGGHAPVRSTRSTPRPARCSAPGAVDRVRPAAAPTAGWRRRARRAPLAGARPRRRRGRPRRRAPARALFARDADHARDARVDRQAGHRGGGAGRARPGDARSRPASSRGAAPGEVVLVGGGDPTLTARPAPRAGLPAPATLAALADADRGRAAAAHAGRASVRLGSTTRCSPARASSPGWPPAYVAAGVVAPVTALAVDEGRVRAGSDARDADPAAAAGPRLRPAARGRAASRRRRRCTAGGARRRRAAELAARRRRRPVAAIVERMLATQRQRPRRGAGPAGRARRAARRRRSPAARRPWSRRSAELGVDAAASRCCDGSGLSRGDRCRRRRWPRCSRRARPTARSPALRAAAHRAAGRRLHRHAGRPARRRGAPRPRAGRGAGQDRHPDRGQLAGRHRQRRRPRLLVFVVMADGVPGGARCGA